MSTLDRALEIAASALAGKVDKAGEPLILHVCRVVLAVERYFPPGAERDEARVVAALHDVAEDGAVDFVGVTPFDRMLYVWDFPSSVVAAVDGLTRRDDEEYLGAYIPRVIAGGRIACYVKLADLDDNLGRKIPGEPQSAELSRCDRYWKARHLITNALTRETLGATAPAEATTR